MKKYAFAALLLLLFAPGTCRSQALIALVFGKKLSSDRVELGLVLGAQGSFIYGSDTGIPKVGFAIGAYTDIKLGDGDKWSLYNFMVFKSPKGATHMPESQTLAVGTDPAIDGMTIKRSITYFEIDPLFNYKFSPSWSIAAGPMLAFRFMAKDTYDLVRHDDDGKRIGDLNYTYKVTGDTRPFDVGVAINGEYRFMKGKGMRLNLRYAQGFINPYRPSTGLKGLNADIRLGLGIPIGSRPKAVIAQ